MLQSLLSLYPNRGNFLFDTLLFYQQIDNFRWNRDIPDLKKKIIRLTIIEISSNHYHLSIFHNFIQCEIV